MQFENSLLQQFHNKLLATDTAELTIKNYMSALSGFFDWYQSQNGYLPDTINVTTIDIREWRTWMEKKYKPATVRQRIFAIRNWLQTLVDSGYIADNPANNITLPEISNQQPRPLTKIQESRLRKIALSAVNASNNISDYSHRTAVRNYAIIMVALNCGLRISEIADLCIDDVVICTRSGSITVEHGKGSKSRTVPINADVRSALSAWLHVRTDWLAEIGIDSSALWIGKSGGMSITGIEYQYNRVALMAGVPTGMHRLRHTCITRLVSNNAPLPVVQKIAGHASIQTTMLYTAVTTEQMQNAVETLCM